MTVKRSKDSDWADVGRTAGKQGKQLEIFGFLVQAKSLPSLTLTGWLIREFLTFPRSRFVQSCRLNSFLTSRLFPGS